MSKKIYVVGIGIASFFIVSSFQNCSQFGIDQSKKFELISSVQVFKNQTDFPTGNEEFDEGHDWVDQPETFDGTVGNGDGGMNQPGGPNQGDGGTNQPGGVNQLDGGITGLPLVPIVRIDGNETFITFPNYVEVISNQNRDPSGNLRDNPNNPNDNMNPTLNVDGLNGNNRSPGSPVFNFSVIPTRTVDIRLPGVEKPVTRVLSIPVNRVCFDRGVSVSKSDRKSIGRTPLVLARTLSLVIMDMNKNIICQIDDTNFLKKEVFKNGQFDFSRCQEKIIAPFLISLYADGNKKNNLLSAVREPFAHNRKSSALPRKVKRGDALEGINLLFSEDPRKSKKEISFAGFVDSNYDNLCDEHFDPLFIDFRSQSEQKNGYQLSSPENGVLFDIQGEGARPSPNSLKRISWFKDDRMAFIALPDQYGRVMGIDQLFGDSTVGPDGKFAKNGFHALSKFDGLEYTENNQPRRLAPYYDQMKRVPDGIIDINDDIYSKLRLWKDKNSNGIGEPGELMTLEESGVSAIDLLYDPSFKEKDEYGNVVKYKSVVRLTSGEYRLAFDIWFKVSGNSR